MSGILKRLKHEFYEVLPPTIFFFVAFQLIAFTRALMLQRYGIEVSTFGAATLGALVVGKVVLISDKLPFMNRFPGKALIYNVVWKTAVYIVAALIVRYAEHILPFFIEHGSISVANQHLLNETVWPHFWAIQTWLLVLFFIYSALRELVRVLGADHVVDLFFRRAGSNAA